MKYMTETLCIWLIFRYTVSGSAYKYMLIRKYLNEIDITWGRVYYFKKHPARPGLIFEYLLVPLLLFFI